jgi:glycosyltransferase involved in cell wall biosynthesis
MKTTSLRIMWLINHSTLRNFEIDQLKKNGVEEIFLPKKFPYDEGNLSASVVFDHDKDLTLSREDVDILNAQDWYCEPSQEAWNIANRHFDVIFLAFFPRQLMAVTSNFRGAIVLRPFGLSGNLRYSDLIMSLGGERLVAKIIECGRRFWFGMGYSQLADDEDWYIRRRSIFLPVGLKDAKVADKWVGGDKKIFFVCPRIETSPYFNAIYKKFIKDFKGIDYCVGGAQPIRVDDEKVLGFVDSAQHEYNMTQLGVMYYHSQEVNHIHYHPFEAVKAGMPLVFMANGALDALGGKGLPGRCNSVEEARRKVERIISGDRQLIESIRSSQQVLLKAMSEEVCGPIWREGFHIIAEDLGDCKTENYLRPVRNKRKKIAVILPVEYRGGTLRGALSLCNAIHLGAEESKDAVDVVFCHIDDPHTYSDEDFDSLSSKVGRRPMKWRILDKDKARRSMRYSGVPGWEPDQAGYMVPEDGIRQLQDCDLWIVVSDRLEYPLLPLRPYVLMVYDYIQAYEKVLPRDVDQIFINAARKAHRVWVTTDFTYGDGLRYAGISHEKIAKVPMLISDIEDRESNARKMVPCYFLWMTNKGAHKNHVNFVKALSIYYEEYQGILDCWVTGVETDGLRDEHAPHLREMFNFIDSTEILRKRLKWCGELSDFQLSKALKNAGFLAHPVKIDNGTFGVVEAAKLGTPSISSDYPAMKELDQRYEMNLTWMDPKSPRDMARGLKRMEESLGRQRSISLGENVLQSNSVEHLASIYWREVKKCL